jgi:hypothetical protein
MKLNDVKSVLKELILKKVPVTPMLWGRHGMGKSALVHQVGKELGYKVIVLTLSQKEAVDVAGMLYTYHDPDLNMSITASHPPQFLAEAVKNGKCIIFLDEFNMGRREVLNAAFEIVLDRRLNNLHFKDDVFVLCAGNPDDERYDVTPLSESLRDRLMHIKLEHDIPSWLLWAEAEGNVHSDVVNFIRSQPSAAYEEDKRDDAFPVEIKRAERSWDRVSKIHALNLPLTLKAECYRGIVGLEMAQAFIKTLDRTNLPLSSSEILSANKAALKRAFAYATISPLRVDILGQSLENLMLFLKSTEATTKQMENTVKFIELLPADLASNAISQLVELTGWLRVFESSAVIDKKITDLNAIKSISKQRGA